MAVTSAAALLETSDYWYDREGNAHRINDEKIIRMNGVDPVLMSFEEVHQQFQKRLKSTAYRWSDTYEYDEIYQVASIALWRAFIKYDATQCDTPFTAFAGRFIKYAILTHHNKYKPKFGRKTSQIKSVCSLHDLVAGKDGEGTELLELIGKPETFTQETVEKIVLDRLLKKIPKQQLQDIMAYVDGFKLTELAQAKDVAKQTLFSRMQNSFMRFRALYIKELVR